MTPMNNEYEKNICNRLFDKSNFKFLELRLKSSTTDDNVQPVWKASASTDNGSMAFCSIYKPYTSKLLDELNIESCADISFRFTKACDISSVFKDYQYEFIQKVINNLYNIGKNFNIYISMTHILLDNLTLAQVYTEYTTKEHHSKLQEVKLTSIGEVKLNSPFFEKNKEKTKLIRSKPIKLFVKYKIIEDEIHPIVLLTFPYGAKQSITFHLDIHPSIDYKNKLESINNQYTNAIIKNIDLSLKRHLKLKRKDLNELSVEHKKDFLKIIEMSLI